jgi:hypothetical protein
VKMSPRAATAWPTLTYNGPRPIHKNAEARTAMYEGLLNSCRRGFCQTTPFSKGRVRVRAQGQTRGKDASAKTRKPGKSDPRVEGRTRRCSCRLRLLKTAPGDGPFRRPFETAPRDGPSRRCLETTPGDGHSKRRLETAPRNGASRRALSMANQNDALRRPLERLGRSLGRSL